MLLEFAPLGVVECVQGVRRNEIVDELLLHRPPSGSSGGVRAYQSVRGASFAAPFT
jgi:hypothetical protein